MAVFGMWPRSQLLGRTVVRLPERRARAGEVALGGAIIGFALPLASALTQTANPIEFAAWGLLAGVIQIVASLLVRRVIVRDMVERIEANNIASAVYLAATSIGVGLLNAASMTY